MPKTKLYKALAACGQAYMNCRAANPPNTEWADKHMERLTKLAKEHLPHGSGLDGRVEVVYAGPDRISIETEFHHMDENGSYDGWTEHRIVVKPELTGLRLTISGPNRNDIKDYLHEVFEYALQQDVEEYPQ